MADLFHLPLLVAALGLGASAAQAGEALRPVSLIAEPSDSGVAIRVVGNSDHAIEVRYTLEVQAGTGNHSKQSGTARLKPEQAVTLISTNVSVRGGDGWKATLQVTAGDGSSYEVTRHG